MNINHNNNSASLWAVPPTQQPQSQQQQHQQLWAVTPNTTNTIATDTNDLSNDLGRMQINPSKKSAAFKPLPTPPLKKSSRAEFWGERPPAEVVFQHMEQYFDSKDLDKEVVVEPIKRHTKSIRLVAREASRKYRNNKMVRRKSTKLWGQRVVELKARSQNVMARLPSVSEHMRLSHGTALGNSNTKNENDDDTMQWIRGKLIGKGSFGRVYLAFNVGTGEVIAVKQVEIPKTASDLLNEEQHDMVEALYQEIMTLRDLDHENIVQYLGYGQDNAEGVINIFLDYVSGGSVASRLALHGAFDEALTKYFTRQICFGLSYLHSKHILHRVGLITIIMNILLISFTCRISKLLIFWWKLTVYAKSQILVYQKKMIMMKCMIKIQECRFVALSTGWLLKLLKMNLIVPRSIFGA